MHCAVQAQGATGRHHQGNQEAQLSHEPGEKRGQKKRFAEATAKKQPAEAI